MSLIVITLLTGFFLSAWGTALSIRLAARWNVHAVEDDRTLHAGRIPRLGGLGMMPGWSIPLILAWPSIGDYRLLIVWGCLMAVFMAGLYDDAESAKGSEQGRKTTWIKLLTQAGTCLVAARFLAEMEFLQIGGPYNIPLMGWGWVIVFFWLLTLTNIFNFMDGANGLAGGTAVVIGFFLTLWNLSEQNTWAMILSLSLCASAAGFLPFNFPQARTFMGDAGSLPLGLGLAIATLPAARGYSLVEINVFLALLIWCPFILDGSLTLFWRMWKKENIFSAHCSHCYQNLIKGGISHVELSLLYWNLAILANLIALRLFR